MNIPGSSRPLGTVLALFVGTMVTAGVLAMSTGAGASSPWPLVDSHLPATIAECSPHQAASGGASYTNLWTLKITAVDLVGEKVFTNAHAVAVGNPRMSLNVARSFSDTLATAFAGQRSFIESALATKLQLPRTSSLWAAKVVAAHWRSVPAHHSLVIYATSSVDVSQGFYSRVSSGCNARGSLGPWVLSMVPVGAPTYHVAIEPTSALVNSTYQPRASVPYAVLEHLVRQTSPTSTGPLPTGFGFPKVQTELTRNDQVVAYTHGGRGSIFLGWLKDRLPTSNRLSPFKVSVVRTGTW
ncbi:MAG: hypothetical protein KGI65_04795 [Acidobacteriota bacterium]|nr:hypothetical protein [Acidobacteriota bacterium]